ncbi:hypothetical protein OQA88_2812 [Cercophora sp. LCS_1]
MADWVPPLPAGYNDANRVFLQALMARGSLTFSEARSIIARVRSVAEGGDGFVDDHLVTLEDIADYVRSAREAVEALDFDIRVTRHQAQNDGERVWVFTNTNSDPPTQLATTRSPEEVAYIKRLLDAMFAEYNTPRMEVMAVDEAQALKVSRPPRSRESNANSQANSKASASTDKGLKHSEVISLLSSLVAEGWLDRSHAKFYSLSPRALVELWSWLTETFNDPDEDWQQIKFCEACKEIVTYGQRCTERDCQVRLHDICEAGFWRTQPAKKCPKCETPWDGNHFVGERAVTSRRAERQAERGRRSGGGSRRNREDDDEEPEEE